MTAQEEVTPPRPTPRKPGRRVLRWLLRVVIGVPLLLVLLVASLYLPPVQNIVRGKAAGFLQERIGTRVDVQRLTLRFPLGVELSGLYVEDERADTLLYAGELQASLNLSDLI